MADRIKGITIEIGGNTTKLTSELSKTDSAIKKTSTALKDVNKLLKLDPGNTELLKQKYKDLTDQIGKTKDRLATLREAERQMAGTDMTAEQREQYEALQREIIATEQQLKKLNGEMKDFGGVGAQKLALAGQHFEEFGGKVQAVGGKISDLGTSLLPVTGAIVAAGAAAVAAWKEVDAANDTIIAKTGATGDALEDLQERAERIATTIPTSFATAGQAIGEVYTRFDMAGDELEDVSRRFIEFAELNNTDVKTSVDTVQKAMAAWGVENKDTAAFLDVLNAAAQKTGVSVMTIAQNAATNAASLKELNYTAADAAFFLGNIEKNGIDASAVMTGLKKAYANAVKDGKDMKTMLAELEAKLQDSATRAEATQEAFSLFGSKAGGAIADAVATGRLSFGELGTVMEEFAGSVENTFQATLDPLDEMKTQLNEVKSAGADMVDAAAPLIKDVLGKATGQIKQCTGALKGLTDEQKQAIIKGAAVVAAVGPALIAAGKIVSAVGAVVTGVDKALQLAPKVVSEVKAIKTAVLAADPVTLAAVGTITALAAACVYFVKNAKEYIDETYGMTEAQKALCEQIEAEREAWEASESARKEAVGGVKAEYAYYGDLAEELRNITDENGRVKEGYEARAKVILGILSEALGEEFTLTDGVIQNYETLIGTIDDLIQTKQVEAMLNADQDAYEEALKNKTEAQLTYNQAVTDAAEQQEKFNQASMNLSRAVMTGEGAFEIGMAAAEKKKAYDDLVELQQAATEAEEKYYGYLNTIANHNALLEAAESGENLAAAMQNVADGFITADRATQGMLEEQVQNYQDAYDNLKRAAVRGIGDVTQAQLTEALVKLERARNELLKKTKSAGDDINKATTTAMAGTKQSNQEPAREVVDQYAEAMENENGKAEDAAATIAGAATDELSDLKWRKSWWQIGVNWVAGLISGMNSKENALNAVAATVAKKIPTVTSKTLQERSPSKLARQSGLYWDMGLIAGMKEMLPDVGKMSAAVSARMSAATAQHPGAAARQAQAVVTAAAAPKARDYSGSFDRLATLLKDVITASGKSAVFTPDGEFVGWMNRDMGELAALADRGV